MKHTLRLVLALVGGALLTLSISSCGSGGSSGGGTTSPIATPAQTIVSGTVQAPGGQVAFFKKNSLADLFVTEAYAALTGLANVPDNTIVQLARLNANATSFTVITTTNTSGGRYSFNLTTLGLQPANDLIVRVEGSGGKQMRTFVVGSVANISPVSEAAYQLAIQSLNGGPLNNLTFQEVVDISGVVNVIGTTQDIGLVTSLNQAVTLVQTAVQGNSGATAFIAAAAANGQTSQGPGDIGNHIPLSQGNLWRYQVTKTETGRPKQNYENTITVNGTKVINVPTGLITTIVLSETNPEGTGVAEDEYVVKDAQGLTEHGNNDATNRITQQLVPYRLLRFPLNPEAKFTQVQKLIDFGEDLDGDGRNESAEVTAEVTVVTFEDVTVPAGAFTNAIKVQTIATVTVITSVNGVRVTVTGTETIWLTSGTGLVKKTAIIQGGGITETTTEELTGSVVNGLGIGGIAGARVLSLATNDLVYDKVSKRIYASVSGNPGAIQAIDPETLSLDAPIPVGNNPNKLALSDDGQYLYVGLDGEAAVQRVHLPSRSAGPKFPLSTDGYDPQCGLLLAEDIAVVPGSPLSVAVARFEFGCIAHLGVSILDNGVPRPLSTTSADRNAQIEFSDSPDILYGYNNHDSGHEIRTNRLTAQGLTVLDITRNVFASNEIRFGAGRIFEQFGRVFDPSSKTVVGSLGSFGTITAVFPDPPLGKIFSIVVPQAGMVLVQANDINTLQILGSSRVEELLSIAGGPGISLIRWGTQGLAFRTLPDKVVIVRSSLVQ